MRALVRSALLGPVLGLVLGLFAGVPVAPARAAGPSISVAVSGAGVALRPAFDSGTSRYAVATTAATGGVVTVDVTTADPAGRVLVDGAPAAGPTTLTGLSAGDEISVIVDDTSGHHAYALVYLPDSFPAITTSVDAGVPQDGLNLVTFGHFAAALDRNGVPARFREFATSAADLKPAPYGGYTVMVQVPGDGGTYGNWDLLVLDDRFRTIASYRTVGLVNTDSHDSVLEPDGTRYLVAYEPDPVTGLTDPVIQEIGPDGQVVHTWDGGDHLDPAAETTANTSTAPVPADWAHINSIEVLPDGDVLASFRHLSAVLRIAWTAHDGYAQDQVEWRFGGRLSDFSFPDDPYGGPCAQHAAQLLANGDLLVWDNGSAALGANPSYCVDPANRTGPTVDRPFTRVTEYSLDTATMTAHLVSSWRDGTRFAYFAGSAYRVGGGDTLVDWAGYLDGPGHYGALASEYDAAGNVVWELTAPTVWSYRAHRAAVADLAPPRVSVTLPETRYDVGAAAVPSVRCTDAGGSTLQSCSWAPVLDTAVVGAHTFVASAVDGAGNTTVVRRSYTVVDPSPGILLRHAGAWRHQAVLRLPAPGTVVRTAVRLANHSALARRVALRGPVPPEGYRIRYFVGGVEVTGRVRAGTWRSPLLAPGATARVEVLVRRTGRVGATCRRTLVASVPGGRAEALLVLRRSR